MKHLALFLAVLPIILQCEGNNMSENIQHIKAQHEQQLMQLPGVVSVGIGLNEAKHPVIIVGLAEPNPETEARISDILEGYPVQVQVVGNIKAR